MPDQELVDRLHELIQSEQDVQYFFEQLTKPDWIPALREAGLLGEPPAPVQTEQGTMFPFWPPSRYLVRVASLDPAAVADAFYAVRDSPNPRVWWDTVDALVAMPDEFVGRFTGHIKRWVHHPWRLGLDVSTTRLVLHLVDLEARDAAVEIGLDMARIVRPDGIPVDDLWVALDDYDYETEVPKIAVGLATFGREPVFGLVQELVRHLETEYPIEGGEPRRDLSLIWRPAIEDHEQNWGHELPTKLVSAIRDGLQHILDLQPHQAEAVIVPLLGNPWPIVRRLGIHFLVDFGDNVPETVAQVLTAREFMADGHYQHEFYRLAETRFVDLPEEARRLYVENVHAVAAENEARAEERAREEDRADADPTISRDATIRRWLGAVSEHLDDASRAELEGIAERVGAERAPDFAAFHTSWMSYGSPITTEEIVDQSTEATIEFLSSWTEPADTFGPGPSLEGLASQLMEAVAKQPDRFAPLAGRFVTLNRRYFGSLVNGLYKALDGGPAFEWRAVLESCSDVLQHAADAETRTETRMSIARLIERGLEERPGEIPIREREAVWPIIVALTEDPEPTTESERRYGPPNMDPLTYSLNSVRGAAFHAVFLFMLWHHRHEHTEDQAWSFADRDPEATTVLDAHLEPERDPSVAVRAVYGWWLPFMLHRDRAWVEARAQRIFGNLSTPLEIAGWETYLFRAWASLPEHEVLAGPYARYAELLAALDQKPEHRSIPADPIERFIDVVVLQWIHRPAIRPGWPLRTLLASGKPWLVAEVVEGSGRLIGRTKPDAVTGELVEGFEALWTLIVEEARNLDGDGAKKALAPFAWWFASPLPADWALRELLRLMANGIMPDPDFAVVRRLPAMAVEYPDETLRVLEFLTVQGDVEWTLRTHEQALREVLAPYVNGEDETRRQRARTLVDQLGRLGLRGLGSLLQPG